MSSSSRFGAVVALFHDVFVTLGVLCFTGREVSLTVVAALLTIAGYSINDTIVVFDRIRERSKALRKEKHSRVMDIAVNETLSRTIITSLTVFLTALALFIWGGEVLRDFSFAMLVGVGVRHLLVGLRRERAGARHLDRARSPQGHPGRVSERSGMTRTLSATAGCRRSRWLAALCQLRGCSRKLASIPASRLPEGVPSANAELDHVLGHVGNAGRRLSRHRRRCGVAYDSTLLRLPAHARHHASAC